MRLIVEFSLELPVINKFLFCFPLRPSLLIWGIVQLLLSSYMGLDSTMEIINKGTSPERVIFFLICTACSVMEVFFLIYLIRGTLRQNPNLLEVCYNYLTIKVPVYFLMLVLALLSRSRPWFIRHHLDSWRAYLLLDNPALGVLDWLTQLYLLLMIRSMTIQLGHQMDFTTLYDRLNNREPKNKQQNNEQPSYESLNNDQPNSEPPNVEKVSNCQPNSERLITQQPKTEQSIYNQFPDTPNSDFQVPVVKEIKIDVVS